MILSALLTNPGFRSRLIEILKRQVTIALEPPLPLETQKKRVVPIGVVILEGLLETTEMMHSNPHAFKDASRPVYDRVVQTAWTLAEIDAQRHRIMHSPAFWGSAAAINIWANIFEAGEITRDQFYGGQGARQRRYIQRNDFQVDVNWQDTPPARSERQLRLVSAAA